MAMAARRKAPAKIKPLTAAKRRAIESAHALEALKNAATRVRILSVSATSAAGSGHPTSCSSIAEILAVLFFDPSGMHYHPQNPKDYNNDKFVLSKGHAAPALYAAWSLTGLIPEDRLLTLRKLNSELEGHPTPALPFVDVASGSLGQGISAACGMAYSMKYFEKSSARVYCVLGDGECAEGSVWEAFNFATVYKLDNLVAIIDVNRLGQSDPTAWEHDVNVYKSRAESFGCHAIIVEGHDVSQLIVALDEAKLTLGVPTVIVARTFKGRDFPDIEDQMNWHGKPLGDKTEAIIAHLKSLLTGEEGIPSPIAPVQTLSAPVSKSIVLPPPNFTGKVATRNAYGEALAAAGAQDDRIISLDGDTKNSTMAQTFQKAFPARFVECYIAEQNMVGVALGLSKRGYIPFVSAFGAFFSRAFDHIRMTSISQGNVKFVGSHAGVSIGEDGASQMALEDLAMFRAIMNSVVLYPSDAYSTYRALEIAANHQGIVYIRTGRPAASLLYTPTDTFQLGKLKVLHQSATDIVTVVAAGVTITEALKAYETLNSSGQHIRVVDLFSVKPVDEEGLVANARETMGRIVTVEDHLLDGGIFDAVASAVAKHGIKVYGLGVNTPPHSGTCDELLDLCGISAAKIIDKIKHL